MNRDSVYQSKLSILAGTDYQEISGKAKEIYRNLKYKSKRKPYIRSPYFKKEKVFLDYFWEHLHKKNSADRQRRLKYYGCAIDLMQNSKLPPFSVQNPNRPNQILHRFFGRTKDKDCFIVQITEGKRTRQKYLISVFPE